MADWVCAKCGEDAPAHALSTSTCAWEPLDTDWLRARLRDAFQAGAESFIRIDWDGPDDNVRIERMWKHHEEHICGNRSTE